MINYKNIAVQQHPICKRCRGQLIQTYGEISCLQCGAPHTERGELARYTIQEKLKQFKVVTKVERRKTAVLMKIT